MNKPKHILIQLPGNGEYHGPWNITYPFLKLSLKYGLLGTWSPNWSSAFDVYAATRGPRSGLPNLVDFSTTMLMNSRVRSSDLKTLTSWLAVSENVERVEAVREALAASTGLHDLSKKSVGLLGRLLDDMIASRGALHGIAMAKIAKWLSAWAPAHVPMIDRHVYRAMSNDSPLGRVPMADVLRRFQSLVVAHLEQLRIVGDLLGSRMNVAAGTITPVRVLDSLIWFDWWACYQYASEFQPWIAPNNATDARSHLLREDGEAYAFSQGCD